MCIRDSPGACHHRKRICSGGHSLHLCLFYTSHACAGSAVGRDREDQPEYQVKMNVAFCFSNQTQALEYYHNSSWLEHGGSPDRAVRLLSLIHI